MNLLNRKHAVFTAIIQARMNSKRLQGKSMELLAGKPLVYHVIERTKAIRHINKVVLAIPNGDLNLPLIDIAKQCGIEWFQGSEENVLDRYYQTANQFPCDYVVRITGDNPFTDPIYGSMAVEIVNESNADLTSITNLPLGTAVEIIKFSALKDAYQSASNQYHFEHVTPYIKEHPELFTIDRHPIHLNNPFSSLRLTIDTDEDLQFARIIYDKLYKNNTIFSINEVITFLQANPKLVEINSHIIQRPITHSEKCL